MEQIDMTPSKNFIIEQYGERIKELLEARKLYAEMLAELVGENPKLKTDNAVVDYIEMTIKTQPQRVIANLIGWQIRDYQNGLDALNK